MRNTINKKVLSPTVIYFNEFSSGSMPGFDLAYLKQSLNSD